MATASALFARDRGEETMPRWSPSRPRRLGLGLSLALLAGLVGALAPSPAARAGPTPIPAQDCPDQTRLEILGAPVQWWSQAAPTSGWQEPPNRRPCVQLGDGVRIRP